MPRQKMTTLQRDVDRLNRSAHLVSHLLIGFVFAHLLAWFNWIIVVAALLIIVGIKEFFVDAVIYKHPFDTQLIDCFEYFVGFAAYIAFLYLLSIFPSSSSIF